VRGGCGPEPGAGRCTPFCVIAITQRIDLSGPVGNLIATLLFGIAEIELQHSKERQAIGIALAKNRGVYTGRQTGTTKAAPARARALRK
jgi:DNA invertase Pin-like site-specific DNA recombinase